MQKRKLGQTDIQVSIIGLGTVKFGRNQGVKYPTTFSLPSDKEIAKLLNLARELGINLLDTAPAYGNSEERLGKWLRNEKRDEWVICSKAGEIFANGISYFDFSKKIIIESIEQSLKRLHTEYLDILLIHSNGDDKKIIDEDNVFETLEMLKKVGKIRAYGMSTKTVDGGLASIELSDIAMVAFNPTYTEEKKVITHAHQLKKGIFIKKALGSGHLTLTIKETMRFIFAEEGVTSVVVGTLNEKHLRENVAGVLGIARDEV